jgi:hypothetical protein
MWFCPVNEMTELVSGKPAPQLGDESSWVRGSELVQGSSGSCVSFWLIWGVFAYPLRCFCVPAGYPYPRLKNTRIWALEIVRFIKQHCSARMSDGEVQMSCNSDRKHEILHLNLEIRRGHFGHVYVENTVLKEIVKLYVVIESSWLQIQRSEFDSRRYHIFWEVVGPERGPLSLGEYNWGATWKKK